MKNVTDNLILLSISRLLFHHISSSNPGAWNIPPSLYVVFHPFLIFSVYSSFLSIGRLIPRYFIHFVAMVNGIDILISLSDFSVLFYRCISDFLCIDFIICDFTKFTDNF